MTPSLDQREGIYLWMLLILQRTVIASFMFLVVVCAILFVATGHIVPLAIALLAGHIAARGID